MTKKASKIHINHAECANSARQLLLGPQNQSPAIIEEDEDGEIQNVARLSVAKYSFIPLSDGKCYCKDSKFSTKQEIIEQNILMNVIEQNYLIQIWKSEIARQPDEEDMRF